MGEKKTNFFLSKLCNLLIFSLVALCVTTPITVMTAKEKSFGLNTCLISQREQPNYRRCHILLNVQNNVKGFVTMSVKGAVQINFLISVFNTLLYFNKVFNLKISILLFQSLQLKF